MTATPSPEDGYDVIIAGAGPAGLSAALVLGRCRRRVLVLDGGATRNARAARIHGFLTRESVAPAEFLTAARADLARFDHVTIQPGVLLSAARTAQGFTLQLADRTLRCRRLLLATGVADELPGIPGLQRFYGQSVHHCPYCDGYEHRDQAIAVYGQGAHVAGLAMTLRTWSSRLLVCTGGPGQLDPDDRAMLLRHGIGIREDPIVRLDGTDGTLERVIFERGEPYACQALFFSAGQHQRSDLPRAMGCSFTDKGTVLTGRCETTNVPGLFVAGDASKATQFVIVAAAEGAEAACEINRSLEEEDRLP